MTKPGASVHAVVEDDNGDCSFMIEELLDSESSWAEVDGRSDRSWSEGEYVLDLEGWSDFDEVENIEGEEPADDVVHVSKSNQMTM